MRGIKSIFVTFSLSVASAPALAHGGHLDEAAGHSHWIGLAALGAVVIVALLIAKSMDRKSGLIGKDAASHTDQG